MNPNKNQPVINNQKNNISLFNKVMNVINQNKIMKLLKIRKNNQTNAYNYDNENIKLSMIIINFLEK